MFRKLTQFLKQANGRQRKDSSTLIGLQYSYQVWMPPDPLLNKQLFKKYFFKQWENFYFGLCIR